MPVLARVDMDGAAASALPVFVCVTKDGSLKHRGNKNHYKLIRTKSCYFKTSLGVPKDAYKACPTILYCPARRGITVLGLVFSQLPPFDIKCKKKLNPVDGASVLFASFSYHNPKWKNININQS